MTIFNIPEDLLEEIFLRLPLRSMRALRVTCKTFNTALSKSPSYNTKSQIGKDAAIIKEGETRMIVLMDCNLYLTSVVFNGTDPSAQHKGKLTCIDSDQVKIFQVYHCEGLVLCILEDDTKLVVWNPFLGQTRWIEPRYSHRRLYDYDRFTYGFGYENKNSCRTYKLLRFIDYFNHAQENQFLCYEIYDFDSDLWTTLDVTPYWRIKCCTPGVSLKRNTYFIASGRNSSEEDRKYGFDDHIICFDFTKERFGPLLRLPFSASDDYVNLSCVREEKLAVLHTHTGIYDHVLHIWITTKIEAEKVLWSKFFTMASEPYYFTINSASFFINKQENVVMGLSIDLHRNHHTLDIIGVFGDGRYYKRVDFGHFVNRRQCMSNVFPYVPSLVNIKQPAGGQRKQQSNLEKRRYDQNMLRLAAFEERNKQKDYGRRKRICREKTR